MKLLNIPGNIGAVRNWLSQFGAVELLDHSQVEQLEKGDVVILPGGNVGGLSTSMAQPVREAVRRGCRLVAVCGSFQSLFIDTDEDRLHACLQLFSGHAYKLDRPRIGRLRVECDWFDGIPYFNHSYAVSIDKFSAVEVPEASYVIDSSGYCVAVKTEQILGVQFHPELSSGAFDRTFQQWLTAS